MKRTSLEFQVRLDCVCADLSPFITAEKPIKWENLAGRYRAMGAMARRYRAMGAMASRLRACLYISIFSMAWIYSSMGSMARRYRAMAGWADVLRLMPKSGWRLPKKMF